MKNFKQKVERIVKELQGQTLSIPDECSLKELNKFLKVDRVKFYTQILDLLEFNYVTFKFHENHLKENKEAWKKILLEKLSKHSPPSRVNKDYLEGYYHYKEYGMKIVEELLGD